MADPGYDEDISSEGSDLDPESRVLEPLQKRIESQLRKNLEELTMALHETSNEARIVRQRREDVGVELYNEQQHLAKLQESLERGHDNFVAIQKQREEKEEERTELTAKSGALQRTLDEMAKKFSKYQNELDKLSETLLKVEQFNEQIQSEIQIERRAAYKAEDDIVTLEKAKGHQDALLDHVNERIRSLAEQHAALTAQLNAQKQETSLARKTLAEALAEMENIQFEKKELVQQWKTSIIGMQRRDEALRSTEEALEEQKEQLMALDNEIIGYRQSIKQAQETNAKLSQILSKTENEVNMLEKQLDAMLGKKTKATEDFNILRKSLEETDTENHQLENEIRSYNTSITAVVKKGQKSANDVVAMEQKVMETLNKQTTLKKASQSALFDIEKMKATIRAKELHVTQMENELARIRVDTLQTQAHNEVLKETVVELEKELTTRDTLIEKMQVDIRRRHDEIERKQKTLDSLNRQFDAIIAAQGTEGGEHVGPLEATINNLSKSIHSKTTENDQLQRDWIRLQTELVNSKNHNHQITESIKELRSQCTILTQKRNRLVTSTKRQREEIDQLERNTEQMHLQMKRLNTLACDNTRSQQELANLNFNIENDLVKVLQERKKEALELERRIDEIRAAKADVLTEMLDAERNIMLWEKKLQIAKETEMALDPNIGKDEIHRMRREIYVMEQRLSNLRREQKRKIEEMQKLIEHRDVLRTKGQAIQAATKAGNKGITKATVSKENHRLAQDLNEKKREAQTKDKQIKECLTNTEQTAVEAEKILQETDDLEAALTAMQQKINLQTLAFSRTNDEKMRKQRTLQRFRDAEKGLYKLTCSPENIEEENHRLDSKKRTLVVVMQELGTNFPQLTGELQDISQAL